MDRTTKLKLKSHGTIYDQVLKTLVEHPETRNDDDKLLWQIWSDQGLAQAVFGADGRLVKYITAEDFLRAPRTESIRRARQKVQEEYQGQDEKHPDLGPTSKKVAERRGRKQATRGEFIHEEPAHGRQAAYA